MDILSLATGCIVGLFLGATGALFVLGLCRAAATGDPESEYFVGAKK
jgi:hypothetical protein